MSDAEVRLPDLGVAVGQGLVNGTLTNEEAVTILERGTIGLEYENTPYIPATLWDEQEGGLSWVYEFDFDETKEQEEFTRGILE